ncbi:hypothetical protein NC652_009355 [Populus alba x Populus x berolinensis]|uniref:Uncharacterized protein n=1 Tax=Populus alba x Populus x berolinensis TaxID=444605 RepID=A0AAD6R970_9ROSI|nr:hypothetical protein NC652_009355 [Populus alba x Populus x berolinensis]KAJ7004473.1 hypothetical protein NC653_009357 [Populus alba x Populus x berolinensis]
MVGPPHHHHHLLLSTTSLFRTHVCQCAYDPRIMCFSIFYLFSFGFGIDTEIL